MGPANAKSMLLRVAHTLTLIGLVQNEQQFSENYLGRYPGYLLRGVDAYWGDHRMYEQLRMGLAIGQIMLMGQVEEAGSPTDMWQATIRYKTLVLLIKRYERWAGENSILI
jgi:hypothetical protein